MFDLYMKAADKKSLEAALKAADLGDASSNPASPMVCLDRIGEINRITGYDANGSPTIETLPGYHANLRLAFEPTAEQIAALSPVTIPPPPNPYRVWA